MGVGSNCEVFLVGMFGLLDCVLKYRFRFRGYQSCYEAGANPAIRYYRLIYRLSSVWCKLNRRY